MRRRWNADFQQVIGNHVQNVIERHRSNGCQIEAPLSGADRDAECKPLLRQPLLVRGKAGVQFGSQTVEQDWIFGDFAGEESLGEAGYEDRIERHSPGSFHWSNKNRSIALRRRWNADLQQKIRNHVQNVVERDWSDGCHRREFRKRR